MTTQTETQKPFLVYGTLRPGHGNYSWALAGRTTSERTVTLSNFKMYAGERAGFPYVIEGNGDDVIVADLVYVHPDEYDEVLDALDHLEGFQDKEDENSFFNHYVRKTTTVFVGGYPTEAYIYVAAPHVAERVVLNSNHLVRGDWDHFVAIREGQEWRRTFRNRLMASVA